MKNNFNFPIKSKGAISALFLQHNITDFEEAMDYTRRLPYGRNKNKYDLSTVFIDNCGTCGTKHALLKALAVENEQPQVKLMLGIIKMGSKYSAAVGELLLKNKLDYIPEAHNYLRIHDEIVDCTTMKSSAAGFINELISEIEIEPDQVTDFKVNYHKVYLQEWLTMQQGLYISLEELWMIREKCIEALSRQ